MIVTVSEIVVALHQQKKTCVLTLQCARDEKLFKIYFKDGEIRSLSLGPLRDAECLKKLPGMRFRQYSFIVDSSEHIPAGTLSSSEVMEHIRKLDCTVSSGPDTVFGHTVRFEAVPRNVLHDVEESIVNIAGPVATLILAESCDKIGYERGGELSRGALQRLLNLLIEDLPDADRGAFMEKFRSFAV